MIHWIKRNSVPEITMMDCNEKDIDAKNLAFISKKGNIFQQIGTAVYEPNYPRLSIIDLMK